ncbi:MAG TPA: EAL domain-containing protein [Mycobacteriales bacterium]|nr:EAL domain-containing protein [Mycobacteriales bacterium]
MPDSDVSRARTQVAGPPLPQPRPAERPGAVPPALVGQALTAWSAHDDGCLALLVDDGDGPRVRWVSAPGAELVDRRPEELLGQPLDRLLPAQSAAGLLAERRVVQRSLVVPRRDGTQVGTTATALPLAGTGRPAWVVRLVRQPDPGGLAEELRAAHERFRALADRAPLAVFCAPSGEHVRYANPCLGDLLGVPPEALTGTAWLDRVHAEDRPAVASALARVLRGAAQDLPLRVVRPDGEQRSVRARVVPVRDGSGTGFVGTLEDVTERQVWEASLAHEAAHDPLTGLLNRSRLLHLLDEQLRAAPAGRPALLLVDLDDFKRVNDALGHDGGDRLLREVARRLRHAVREGDVVSRFGGDEFAVLCADVPDERTAGEVARRVHGAVTGPLRLGGAAVPVSGSIGVVLAGPGHVEAADVLRDADAAMYQAKSAGKDRWALFDEAARQRARDRVALSEDLRTAVAEGTLGVHYQPVVRLPDDDGAPPLASVEALARWHHPQHGPVPPADFVALAEEEGLVSGLGLHVLRSACRQMRAWQGDLGDAAPSAVSVNVSALQLAEPDFPDVVATVLRETSLDGGALCLELTETVVMQDTAAAAKAFWRLHALGVRIAIDDFGTGYSSLAVLRRLPFDQLKIDRSLLVDLRADRHDPVVAAVVAMGRALDLDVVAEGVETEDHVRELRRLGCPYAQGYLFGRPLPPDDLARWALGARVAATG